MDEVNRITYICPRAAGRPISMTLTRVDQLRILEAEAVHVIREVVAELERPVDTGHNFPEVIEFRDRRIRDAGHELIVASVQESIDRGRVQEDSPTASRHQLQTRRSTSWRGSARRRGCRAARWSR
jgi:sulfate adenylyltransferase subunit 2